jgi:hypothetical protein
MHFLMKEGGSLFYDFNSGSDVAKEAGEYPTSFSFILLLISIQISFNHLIEQ